jgi:hypothetical protein
MTDKGVIYHFSPHSSPSIVRTNTIATSATSTTTNEYTGTPLLSLYYDTPTPTTTNDPPPPPLAKIINHRCRRNNNNNNNNSR